MTTAALIILSTHATLIQISLNFTDTNKLISQSLSGADLHIPVYNLGLVKQRMFNWPYFWQGFSQAAPAPGVGLPAHLLELLCALSESQSNLTVWIDALLEVQRSANVPMLQMISYSGGGRLCGCAGIKPTSSNLSHSLQGSCFFGWSLFPRVSILGDSSGFCSWGIHFWQQEMFRLPIIFHRLYLCWEFSVNTMKAAVMEHLGKTGSLGWFIFSLKTCSFWSTFFFPSVCRLYSYLIFLFASCFRSAVPNGSCCIVPY